MEVPRDGGPLLQAASAGKEAPFPASLAQWPEEEYFSDSTRVTNSSLKVFAKSPVEYKRQFIDGIKTSPKKSPALTQGKLVHALIEGDASSFAVSPGFDKRTKAGKEAHEAWEKENEGKTVVTQEDLEEAEALAEAAAYYLIESKIDPTHNEATLLFEVAGIECKGRLDLLQLDGYAFCIDFKTCSSLADFERHFFDHKYHVQAAFYTLGLRQLVDEVDFRFVALSKSERMACPYSLNDQDLLHAMNGIPKRLEQLKGCMATGIWDTPKELKWRR